MSHAAVWIDKDEARVFTVASPTQTETATFDEATLKSPNHHVHRHPKGQGEPHGHPDDDHRFFKEVADRLAGAQKVLVVGPSKTKLHFLRWLHEHAPTVEKQVVGVETADHPTDRQIAAHVRHYFHDDAPRET